MDKKLEHLRENYRMILSIEQNNRQKNIIKMSSYSQLINPYIFSVDELEIYQNLNLTEGYITRPCLLADIDITYVTETGKTNLERMLGGHPPIDPLSRKEFVLHHIGQRFESPYAEIPKDIHAKKYYRIIHRIFSESWRSDKELIYQFNKDSAEHWIKRGEAYSADK